ncbi:Wide host range VirA protein [Planctomycetes bacterium Pan216]|uniref:histidine kinase n=1 Tax=Kolteria novifilia TaxID=2527975 RepID=A0A518AWT5_9BACT|nr:Wide host range VirA protein [Planctomycetes bacterium Pan216]
MKRTSINLLREIGISGLLTILGIVALLVVVITTFVALRPPTVEEVERDIWVDWARLATDAQGLTIVDQLRDRRQAAGQLLVETLGNLINTEGDRFVVRTDVRDIRIRDIEDNIFANWRSSSALASGDHWRELDIDLVDPFGQKVGTLEVSYQFYGGGLESLPNIRRIQTLYRAAQVLVVIIAIVILVALGANISRIRERAARLRSQQVTLDLARQMCHELRNGLWAFSLEGRNLHRLFEMIDQYVDQNEEALAKASERVGLEEVRFKRLLRTYLKLLAEHHLDPRTDLAASNDLAKEAHQRIDSFSRYINLTVEQLDRNLLGMDDEWHSEVVRLGDAWAEACKLLEMRLRSEGVTTKRVGETEQDAVWADRRALVHVFVNLAKNAVEAMRDSAGDRIITVALTREETMMICEVHNPGRPIPAESLPHLFEAGYSTKQGASRGQGLALVHEAITAMGGQIDVTSDAAQGTRFVLRLPRADQE